MPVPERVLETMRRLLLFLVCFPLLLSACGQAATVQPTAAPAAEATEAPVAPTEAPVEPTAAPAEATQAPAVANNRIFEHKFGTTEVPNVPERVVTIGLTEQDAFLALGTVPVGTSDWFGGYPGAIWPWAQDKLNGQIPEIVDADNGIGFEKVAALKPDLIVALYTGITEEEYQLLSAIAPTVGPPAEYNNYGIPWQVQTQIVGRILDKEAEAQALIDEIEQRFVQIRAEHPEFIGKTAVTASAYQGIWLYGAEDPRGRFLTSLGFVLPEELDELVQDGYGATLSLERADMIDVDLIIWLDPEEAEGELGGPLYASLPVHTEGREVMVDSYKTAWGGATSFVSVLSLPYLLDEMLPRIELALDGDPATVVPAPQESVIK
jgi:iron complex transport system substrate-binding protein